VLEGVAMTKASGRRDLFQVHRNGCGGQQAARCSIGPHLLGWELRLEFGGAKERSVTHVSHDDALRMSEQWKGALLDKGWQ
jgi:hypothetical protein